MLDSIKIWQGGSGPQRFSVKQERVSSLKQDVPQVAAGQRKLSTSTAGRHESLPAQKRTSSPGEEVVPSGKPSKPLKKEVERIGTNLTAEEQEFLYQGSKIILTDPQELPSEEEKRILVKTNISSENNPLSRRFKDEVPKNFKTTYQQQTSNVMAVGANSSHQERLIGTIENTNISSLMAQHSHVPATPSVHQTIEEMDFQRGLWYPALTGDLTTVRQLLEKGHCPNEEDKSGYTALHYAARCGYTTICSRLIEAGAEINATTRAGKATPLHRAALAGNDETVQLLLRYGANPKVKDQDGRCPLHRAVEGGNPTTVLLLLETCPEMASQPDKAGKTPVQYASANPQLQTVFSNKSPQL